jgi:hypothetical protein
MFGTESKFPLVGERRFTKLGILTYRDISSALPFGGIGRGRKRRF